GPLPGHLIVIEGTDGVGRSTQIELLRPWLELEGYAVSNTGWTRSPLLSDTINEAKAGHELTVVTFSLLYAADFADRLEHQIIPVLRAGFIVIADRYMYTAFARHTVMGADPHHRPWAATRPRTIACAAAAEMTALRVPQRVGLVLSPDDGAAVAARVVVRFHLRAFVRVEPAARAGEVEPVHQLRVATRRLRTALRLFAP